MSVVIVKSWIFKLSFLNSENCINWLPMWNHCNHWTPFHSFNTWMNLVYLVLCILFFFSCLLLEMIQSLQMGSLSFAGLRQPTMAMFLTSENKTCLWLLPWIWEMHHRHMAVFTQMINKMSVSVWRLLDGQLLMKTLTCITLGQLFQMSYLLRWLIQQLGPLLWNISMKV